MIAVAVQSANGDLSLGSFELSVDLAVIGAALCLDAQSAVGPQRPLGAETVRGLQNAQLANLVLLRVGQVIWDKCHQENVVYSCWVDDLAFSGDNARAVLQTAVEALRTSGFAVSHSKLKICGPGERKMLTGRMLGRFISVHPERLARIRSGIHKLETGEVALRERAGYIRSLEGQIAYIANIIPHKGIRLKVALETARAKGVADESYS